MEEAFNAAKINFSASTFLCNSNLRFASAVDKGADWIVSSCPTDVQVSPVPWLN